MNNKQKITAGFILSLLVIICVILHGCNNFFLTSEKAAAADGYGKVIIRFLGDDGRTVFPALDIFDYEYTFSRYEYGEVVERLPSLEPDGAGVFTLPVGNWIVDVEAYIDEVLVASGASMFLIGSGVTKQITVILDAVDKNTDEGTFRYEIQYPEDAVPVITLHKLPGGLADVISERNTVDLGEGNAAIRGTCAIDSGFYLLTIKITIDGSGYYAGISESVRVYPNITTEYKKTYTQDDYLETTVNIAAIEGLTAPVNGEIPVDTITETDQYTGSVEWYDDEELFDRDTFEAATVYTAFITLTAKPGYTFAGVAEDFFTVAGADTVSNSQHSGIVTAVFPRTESGPVIDITDQPEATTDVVFGAITGSLSVTAVVSDGSIPSYLWYSNTINDYDDAAVIDDATDAEFEIPESLNAGTYYYFCEISASGADEVQSVIAKVIVAKANGADVTKPEVAEGEHSIPTTHITINAVSAPDNGQTVEYNISENDDETDYILTTWQPELTFEELDHGTGYYVYARSAENANYKAGEPQVSEMITTHLLTSEITITEQPEAVTNVVFGAITGSLSVEAEVSDGSIPYYHWHVNTTNSYDGSIPIHDNANDATFTIPTDLSAGTYYYFCEVSADEADDVQSDFAKVIVAKTAGVFGSPAALNTTYTTTLTLADVTPAAGYTWDDSTTALDVSKSGQSFPATYINPNGNYEEATGEITVNIAKATGVFGTPAALNTTYTTTLTLADVTPAAGYTWDDSTTALDVSKSGQSFPATYINPNGNYEEAIGTITVNVAKAAGDAVGVPVEDSVSYNRITISAVSAPANGQTVEYNISENDEEPSFGAWQTGLTFTGLEADTEYFVYARSASNTNYNAGTPSVSLGITTTQSGTGEIAFYWVNEQDKLVYAIGAGEPAELEGAIIHASPGVALTINAANPGYTVIGWWLNGVSLNNITTSYTFSKWVLGPYNVTLLVVKDGRYYNTNFVIEVEE